MSSPLIRPVVSILSPLRYPGAKRRLSHYIAQTLVLNKIKPKLFVEPFAGGASVALQLLNDGLVEQVALGELDPWVASFWKTVFTDADWLIEQIKKVPVTIEKWDYFRKTNFYSDRDRALACIFLNRTSFSGILNEKAGPIGGRNQRSRYKIDCRFTVQTIIKRIEQAFGLGKRVLFVNNADWKNTIFKTEGLGFKPGDVCYYLDPPFFAKADRLYRFYFQASDHKTLHDALMKTKHHWILSYDSAKPIKALYSHNGCGPKRIHSLYSTGVGAGPQEVRELVISSLPDLPKETRLWRSNEEWNSDCPDAHFKKSIGKTSTLATRR